MKHDTPSPQEGIKPSAGGLWHQPETVSGWRFLPLLMLLVLFLIRFFAVFNAVFAVILK